MSRAAAPAHADPNRLSPADRAVHGWYRFVLSFPPHLVRTYLERFNLGPQQTVLDPFCGTGTTLVEARKLGIRSVGVEAHPLAHFAATIKVDWSPDPRGLLDHARRVAEAIQESTGEQASSPLGPLRTLLPAAHGLLLTGSISPLPLHRTLALLDRLGRDHDPRYDGHERLALASALATSIGNLHFGPEVGVGTAKPDAPVAAAWLRGVRAMAEDLEGLPSPPRAAATAHRGDARRLQELLPPALVDAVITSPPYPNEKDYTRATRLESVLLGFVRDRAELRALKRGALLRSNSRTVYRGDDDDRWVAEHAEIQRLATEIEARRRDLGKTSGFERQYARVTRLYFGGMARHLAQLRAALRPGARLAYVVGDQASYFQVLIHTGRLLAGIAEQLGYQVLGIDLFRTRLATATRQLLREEVVVLRWPGPRCAAPTTGLS